MTASPKLPGFKLLVMALAMALAVPVHGQGTPPAETAPAAPPAAAASAGAGADAIQDNTEASDDGEGEEEPAAAPGAGTNAVPSLSVPGSTNAPGTNTPARRPSRRSSRRPERSGISDWRPSGRSSSGAASTNGPSKSDYAYFQLVNDRNIFNPARVPNRPDRPRSTETRRTPKVESLSLVGTLRYEKGIFAFFDGTSPEFRKALKSGDTVGGHRILSVTDSTVRLVVKDAAVDLKVGSQLRREDEGDWTLASGVTLGASPGGSSSSGSTPSSSASSNSSSTPSTASASGSSGGGAEDILRRLRERRAQETKQ